MCIGDLVHMSLVSVHVQGPWCIPDNSKNSITLSLQDCTLILPVGGGLLKTRVDKQILLAIFRPGNLNPNRARAKEPHYSAGKHRRQ